MREEFKVHLILSIIRNKVSYECIMGQDGHGGDYEYWSYIQTSVISGIDYWDDETINEFFLLLSDLTSTKIVKFFADEEGFISQ